jgi:hypothetical protein
VLLSQMNYNPVSSLAIPDFEAERYSLIADGSNFDTRCPESVSVRCGHPVTLSLLSFIIFKR